MAEQKKQERVKTKKFMNRNVTQFRHFIKHSYITQNDLNWVINLRDNNLPKQISHTESHPPQVFFKKTKAYQLRCKSQEREQQKNHKNQLSHMVWRDKSNTKQTEQQINFYSQLRNQDKYASVTANSTPKNFDNYPFKDRKQLPTFIKKESIRKLRQLTDKDKQCALDGAHKQQPYTQNILKSKNYALLEVFTKKHGRSEVSLPTLAWQTGLRNYRT